MATLAEAILAERAPAKPSEPVESEGDAAAHAAAEEILSAVEKKDKKALRRALKNLRIIDTTED
jgi:2C-methyl-D-erythritol 2,4-cyclodiphosphate synthase